MARTPTCKLEYCIRPVMFHDLGVCRECYERVMARELREELDAETQAIDRVEERTGEGRKEKYW